MTQKNQGDGPTAGSLETLAGFAGIDVPATWREGVQSHLDTAQRMVAIIDSGRADQNAMELASIFRPGEHSPKR